MTGRASVWTSAELRELAREFVPVADEVWRLHILETEQYQKDCGRLFGRILQHSAKRALDSVVMLRGRQLATRGHYATTFGSDPPEEYWGVLGGIRFPAEEDETKSEEEETKVKEEPPRTRRRVEEPDNNAAALVYDDHLFQIFIKRFSGPSMALMVSANFTILRVKEMIQTSLEDITVGEMRLIWNGKQLEDGRKIGDYKRILKESTLYLSERLTGR